MSENQQPESIEVFISYSHDSEEHKRRVLALADQLVRNGLDVTLDRFVENGTPDQAWPLWMEKAIERADFVLIVCSETYLRRFKGEEGPNRGAGVRWESIILYNTLYDSECKLSKFVPIGFEDGYAQWIPKPLRGTSHYPVVDEDSYLKLYRVLSQQPEVVRPTEGKRLQLPPQSGQPLFPPKAHTERLNGTQKNTPNYGSAEERELGERLNHARLRKSELAATDADLSGVNAEILEIKRKLRDGFQLKAGDIVGNDRFRLIDIIGDGGFATVWKAYDLVGEELIALKVLHGQYARGQSHKMRFFRGARQMAKLRHPNVVSVIERRGKDGNIFFFAMELVEGIDLHRWVRTKSPLLVEEVVRIVSAIGEGLAHAHGKKIIHRDVKPSNILVGGDGTVKLTDFDLVKAEETTGGTRTGAMGSFIFAAPELMIQAKAAEKSADVYGLAMTAVFGMYGKDLPPIVFRDPASIINDLKCPQTVKAVLIKGTAWEVADRYQTVVELCEALKAALEAAETDTKAPIPSRPEPRAPQAGKGPGKLERVPDPQERDYWVRLEPGTFQMGDDQSSHDVEKPAHPVRITRGFWMGRVPVTNAAFEKFLDAGGYETPRWWDAEGNRSHKMPGHWENKRYNKPKQPVVGVSWHEANAYCRWLTDHLDKAKPGWWKKGMRIGLPTEAQWEYAARGEEGRKYPWGSPDPDKKKANFGSKVGSTSPVGAYPDGATPEGILDLAGNVWEWCLDSWDGKAYEKRRTDEQDPLVVNDETARVVRGGSWDYGADYLRAAYRRRSHAGHRYSNFGCRCVLLSVSAEHG